MIVYLLGIPNTPMTVLDFADWRKLHPEDFSELVCPTCGGEGWSFKYNTKCYRCDGAGELYGEKAARAVYNLERSREADLLRTLGRQRHLPNGGLDAGVLEI